MKLLLGGGNKKIEGFVNIDILPMPNVDIIHDLNKGLPMINSDHVEEVIAEHVIEHLFNFPLLMNEIHRVCKKGAIVRIVTPHASYPQFWRDPTHVRPFTEETFKYWEEWRWLYQYPEFKILSTDISDLEQMRITLQVIK